jgi:hypothetical protein
LEVADRFGAEGGVMMSSPRKVFSGTILLDVVVPKDSTSFLTVSSILPSKDGLDCKSCNCLIAASSTPASAAPVVEEEEEIEDTVFVSTVVDVSTGHATI